MSPPYVALAREWRHRESESGRLKARTLMTKVKAGVFWGLSCLLSLLIGLKLGLRLGLRGVMGRGE